jgi:hypothetical protein
VFFGGRPLWHASIALWSRLTGRPKPVARWAPNDHSRAARIAGGILAGVGIEDRMMAATTPDGVALHLRKAATDAEQDAIFRTARGRRIAAAHDRFGGEDGV